MCNLELAKIWFFYRLVLVPVTIPLYILLHNVHHTDSNFHVQSAANLVATEKKKKKKKNSAFELYKDKNCNRGIR